MVYPFPDRERTERQRHFWSVRSGVFAVLEVVLALGLLVLGVIFQAPLLAFMLGIVGTLSLIALYMILPFPREG